MGGMGSGRRGGRATVEGCRSLRLDVNHVMRGMRERLRGTPQGERVGASMVWSWTRSGEGAPMAQAVVTVVVDHWRGHARLQFDVAHWSQSTGQQDQTVQMVTSPCRYGGRRWWWVCPATGRRCSKLYLPNGGTRFLSRGRGAYRLPYASQNGSPMDRSHGRLARMHKRLGGEYRAFDDPLPTRPKWMRHCTYDRLWAEWEAAMERHDEIWLVGAERLIRKSH